MQTAKTDPSLLQSARNTEVGERFNRTLFGTLDALEDARIDYALIGGVASSGHGRPRSTHDIDIFVRPEDAGSVLEALKKHGFHTEKTDVNWLFKAFKENILVDVIFKSRGDIYFDSEMAERTQRIDYHGRKVRTVAPEDLVIIKCAVHDEIGPHHWHDALAVLSHATLDWNYMLKRARRAPRRLLALLLYAQSNDIWIPNRVIVELFRSIYGDMGSSAESSASHGGAPGVVSIRGGRGSVMRPQETDSQHVRRMPDPYMVARIKEALMQDSRGGDQDIKVSVENGRVLLRGEVVSEEHRKGIEQVVRETAQGYQVENRLKVAVLEPPSGTEVVG